MQETWVQSLGREDSLEKEMATQSSILAWRIPWTEKLGRLQSMGSQRVGHDWATSLSLSCYIHVMEYYSEVKRKKLVKHSPLLRASLVMAIHSSTIAWKIPWTEEPGRLQSMGSQRVGHDWATSLSLSSIFYGLNRVFPFRSSTMRLLFFFISHLPPFSFLGRFMYLTTKIFAWQSILPFIWFILLGHAWLHAWPLAKNATLSFSISQCQ